VHATIYNRALAYYFQQEHQRSELVSPVMNAFPLRTARRSCRR